MYLKRMQSRPLHPKTVFPSAVILCLLALETFATVKPTIEQMVDRADVVAIGYVGRYSQDNQAVFLKISRVLKGDSRTSNLSRGVNFIYKTPDKGGIDWNSYLKSQEECLFFLRLTKRGSVTLSDSLFGVEKMSSSLRQDLEKLDLGVTSTRWTRIGGLLLFFIAANVFFAATVKLGRNKPQSPVGKETRRAEMEGSAKSEDENAEAMREGN
jgi:hypothetical protein